ncbi:MAG: trypsin-like peptidase domain-containing protein [Planctomycetia bacterium]|nr:trypsin-like peptidase domain-containing protein [Planctomycetia bacterium]
MFPEDDSPSHDVSADRFLLPASSPPPPAPARYPGLVMSRLLLILATLVALVAMPRLLENVQYSLTRGRLRAQAEVAETHLAKYDKIADPAEAFKWVALRMEASVVHINTSRRPEISSTGDPPRLTLPPDFEVSGEGSGVIVDASGYILTNHHVISGAEQISVVLSDDRIIGPEDVTIVGIDEFSDLAVLKVDAGNLVAAAWGDSNAMEVGDWLVAVGAPFGLDRTVTAGILSAKRKKFVDRSATQDFLQTDVAVNPGNSGGPLVNLKGEIVGINTAIVGNAYQGISFAIPSDIAKSVYEQIKANGKAVRGWLGVEMAKLTAENAKSAGLDKPDGSLVTNVVMNSPADLAKIERNDIVVSWGGKPVASPRDLGQLVAETPIDTVVPAEIIRGAERQTVQVKVTDRPLRNIRIKQ